VTGEKPVRTFSFLKQAKAKCAKLQQRTNFEFYPRAGILNCCNQALSQLTGVTVKSRFSDRCREQGWLLKNSVFAKKVKSRVIENV
jgi:hypothetical protein